MRNVFFLVSLLLFQGCIGPVQHSAGSPTPTTEASVTAQLILLAGDNAIVPAAGLTIVNFGVLDGNGNSLPGKRIKIGSQISQASTNSGTVDFTFTGSNQVGLHSYEADLIDSTGKLLSKVIFNLQTTAGDIATISIISQATVGQVFTTPSLLQNPIFEARDAYGNIIPANDFINAVGVSASTDVTGQYPASLVNIMSGGESSYHLVASPDLTGAYTRAKLVFISSPLSNQDGVMFNMSIDGNGVQVTTGSYTIRY